MSQAITSDFYKKMRNRLRELREARGLSQEEASLACGLGKSTLGNYERGAQPLSEDALKKVADFFDVSTSDVTSESQAKEPSGSYRIVRQELARINKPNETRLEILLTEIQIRLEQFATCNEKDLNRYRKEIESRLSDYIKWVREESQELRQATLETGRERANIPPDKSK